MAENGSGHTIIDKSPTRTPHFMAVLVEEGERVFDVGGKITSLTYAHSEDMSSLK